jgi:hypothetical protein
MSGLLQDRSRKSAKLAYRKEVLSDIRDLARIIHEK